MRDLPQGAIAGEAVMEFRSPYRAERSSRSGKWGDRRKQDRNLNAEASRGAAPGRVERGPVNDAEARPEGPVTQNVRGSRVDAWGHAAAR